MRTIERTIVSAVIYSKEGKIFQAKRGNNHLVYPEAWHIPGGGVEAGEEYDEALVRELREELGLDVSQYPIELLDDVGTGESEKILRDTGEKVFAKMKFFTYKIVIDKPAAEIEIHLDPNEFAEYRWTDPKELKNIKLTPPSVELFTRLGYL